MGVPVLGPPPAPPPPGPDPAGSLLGEVEVLRARAQLQEQVLRNVAALTAVGAPRLTHTALRAALAPSGLHPGS